MSLTLPETKLPPGGDIGRFGRRWRLVGAGLSNVWHFGDLELPARSGRLLLRGPNGTGKTTALEALWPYLLDLNARLLTAGRGRPTSLPGLMRAGATGRRRTGYAWLTFEPPGEQPQSCSYGVRLNYSEQSSPQVVADPFFVPGRPLRDLELWGPQRANLVKAEFQAAVVALGGQVFEEPDDYVRDLAGRLFSAGPEDMSDLAQRVRFLRNPALLGEVGPEAAADFLLDALPGVDRDVIASTAEALSASAATREAFRTDENAATVIREFAETWTGHVVDVAGDLVGAAGDALEHVSTMRSQLATAENAFVTARSAATEAERRREQLGQELARAKGELRAIEERPEYEQAQRLDTLADGVAARQKEADTAWLALVAQVGNSAALRRSHEKQAGSVLEDLAATLGDAEGAAPGVPAPVSPVLSRRDRPVVSIAARDIDPGPVLVLSADLGLLDAAGNAWEQRARALQGECDRARLHLKGRVEVDSALSAATASRQEAARQAEEADRLGREARERADKASAVAAGLRPQAAQWLSEGVTDPDLTLEELQDLAWDDPATVLPDLEDWREQAGDWAQRTAAEHETIARQLRQEAGGRLAEASQARDEAGRIRSSNVLLPLPRPAWAGEADDTAAFGSALEWAEGTGDQLRDTVEAVLVASGLLGATLSPDGISTASWAVSAIGPVASPNLGAVLRAAPGHPLAGPAVDVLARIAWQASLGPSSQEPRNAFVVCANGSFRAGVATARVPEASDPSLRKRTSFVGARRRREAALERADELDAQAAGAEAQAEGLHARAGAQDDEACSVRAHGRDFPALHQLRDAESSRAAAVGNADRASARTAKAEDQANRLQFEADQKQRKWVAAVVADGFAPDVAQLDSRATAAAYSSSELRGATKRLMGLVPRLAGLLEDLAIPDDDVLGERADAARRAAEHLGALNAELDKLRELSGMAAAEVVEQRQAALSRIDGLEKQQTAAGRDVEKASGDVGRTQERRETARRDLAEAEPTQAKAMGDLRGLLALPGVVDAVLGDPPEGADEALVEQVTAAVLKRPTAARRTVREKADAVRAELAGVWSLDPGEEHRLVETYVFTYRDAVFAPGSAAAEALRRAEAAEAALRRKDEEALQAFVVGQLPRAIKRAWVSLEDWKAAVNRKMRSASSSSGITVAVRIGVRDDLSEAQRLVYEHVCKTGDGLRPGPARDDVGRALQSLIAGAGGDDMVARVTDAVDIKAWVHVDYLVTRPGEEPRRWSPRTGLSNGERHLVVLSPMLAAVAAAYDRLGESALRLAALDEVPIAVDGTGLEGLARYIAQLDLDLIATSHEWDGAPGAWDGVDAHDLEGASNGTVVAFPMMVRGLTLLPGEGHES
jgi:hypothetical protein